MVVRGEGVVVVRTRGRFLEIEDRREGRRGEPGRWEDVGAALAFEEEGEPDGEGLRWGG